MHRTIKSEEKIFDIVNTLAMIQSSKSQNDEKVKRFEELRYSLRELDMYLTGTAQKDLNFIGKLLTDYH